MITMMHCDCMEYMAGLPDKAFDLAIIDPPYGININDSGTHFKRKYDSKEWDIKSPSIEYFLELFRVSKNQIIWGGNYFVDKIGVFKNFIVWDKKIDEDMSFSMCEMAWTSFINGSKIYRQTAMQESRIHPTQKPVALYKWLLSRYAKPGDNILDTHGGSGSICIACHDLGFDLTWMEKDEDYYNAARKRYNEHAAQGALFCADEIQEKVYQQAVMI